MKVSLGLLPSGPDPVGEEHVRANLPMGYMRIYAPECKTLVGVVQPQGCKGFSQDGWFCSSQQLDEASLVDRPRLLLQQETTSAGDVSGSETAPNGFRRSGGVMVGRRR